MAILRAPILCDCTGRTYCSRNTSCSSSLVGNKAVEVYDCKSGSSCGYRITSYCTCIM